MTSNGRIPVNVSASVHSRSAIGERFIELTPQGTAVMSAIALPDYD